MNLQEVKSFIRKASKEDINEISDQLNDIIKERREKAKAQFSVGDLVRIIHTTVSPDKEFRIIKIKMHESTTRCIVHGFLRQPRHHTQNVQSYENCYTNLIIIYSIQCPL